MDNVKDVLEKRFDHIRNTVNSIDKSINTVNSLTVEEKINAILEEEQIEPEAVGLMLAEGLGDKKSLSYYILLAKNTNAALLLETLHYVKSVSKEKTIHYKPAYFLAVLRRKGIIVKFKNKV